MTRCRKDIRNRYLIIALLLFFCLLTSAVQADSIRLRAAERTAEIETLKQHGLVLEEPDGLLRTDSSDPEIIRLVKEENHARKQNYPAIVKEKCAEQWPANYRMRKECERKLQSPE